MVWIDRVRRGVFSDDFFLKVLLQEYVWLLVARWFLGFVYALWGVGKKPRWQRAIETVV
jgi:uncharacterized membrane protein YqaE (UPF0057 family)